ncbi:MAG: VOC family protein [Gemmatimonadaceae bacterium]
MLNNRSMPRAIVVPVLAYPDVGEAVAWLSAAFGFAERLRIGDHRAQMHISEGAAMVVREGGSAGDGSANNLHTVMVRVEDVQAHFERATAHGARVVHPPTDYPYGERQFTVIDLGGHSWTFSQTLNDVAPDTWGGVLRENV